MIDIQELRDSLVRAVEFLENERNRQTKAAELLLGMAEDMLGKIKHGIDIAKIQYTYVDLYGLVWGKTDSADKAKSTVMRHKQKLKELLSQNSELSVFLLEGESSLLTLETTESKGGAKAHFWLSSLSSSDSKTQKNELLIRYRVSQLPEPKWWVRPLMQIHLKGKTVWFFLSLFVAAAALFIGLVLSVIFLKDIILVSICAACLLLVGSVLVFLNTILEKGVAPAPSFMVANRVKNAFFVQKRATNTGPNQSPHKILELAVWEGKCGICGDILHIEKGGKEFHNRFVGKCSVAPMEHIFTFDHISKLGKFARDR